MNELVEFVNFSRIETSILYWLQRNWEMIKERSWSSFKPSTCASSILVEGVEQHKLSKFGLTPLRQDSRLVRSQQRSTKNSPLVVEREQSWSLLACGNLAGISRRGCDSVDDDIVPHKEVALSRGSTVIFFFLFSSLFFFFSGRCTNKSYIIERNPRLGGGRAGERILLILPLAGFHQRRRRGLSLPFCCCCKQSVIPRAGAHTGRVAAPARGSFVSLAAR